MTLDPPVGPPTGVTFRPVPAVRRASLILHHLADQPGGATLDEITRTLRFPKSSTLGICRTLVMDGLLTKDVNGRYRSGFGVVVLAQRFLQNQDLPSAFRAVLDAHPELDQTVQLAILQGADVIYLARHDGAQPVRLSSSIGGRLPASTTATGKSILASFDDQAVRDLYADLRLPQLTRNSHGDLASFLQDLAATRHRGYAVDNEETMEGVICVGAPIYRFGEARPVAALSITVLKTTSAESIRDDLAPIATRIARDVSSSLGAAPPREPTGSRSRV